MTIRTSSWLLFVATAGCSTVTVRDVTYLGPPGPAKADDCQVPVGSGPPQQPVVNIATIQIECVSDSTCRDVDAVPVAQRPGAA